MDLVPPDRIEQIVGRERHPTRHYGRAVTAETVLYILHSQECLDSGIDLRECPFSQAMVRGIRTTHEWKGQTDVPVLLTVWGGWLVPDFAPEIVPRRRPDDGHPMRRHA